MTYPIVELYSDGAAVLLIDKPKTPVIRVALNRIRRDPMTEPARPLSQDDDPCSGSDAAASPSVSTSTTDSQGADYAPTPGRQELEPESKDGTSGQPVESGLDSSTTEQLTTRLVQRP